MKKRTVNIDHGITDIIDFSSWHKLPEGVTYVGNRVLGLFSWDRAAQIR